MGVEPFPAARAAVTDPVSPSSDTTPMHGRFAMPHALVITTCIITAAVLAPHAMTVTDVLTLIAGAGGTGAAIVIAVVTGSKSVGRIGRLMRAYLNSGN